VSGRVEVFVVDHSRAHRGPTPDKRQAEFVPGRRTQRPSSAVVTQSRAPEGT